MNDHPDAVTRLQELLGTIDADEGLETVAKLRAAELLLEQALNEAMATSALRGASLRRLAAETGLAPNTIAARLSRAPSMQAYAPAGRVTAEDLAVERRSRSTPMTFTRRRKDRS